MKKLFLSAFVAFALFACDKDDDTGNPNCSVPGEITLEEINSRSVLFSWEPNGETAWQIEYGLRGFDVGNGTIRGTSERDFFIEGLEPLTDYTILLRANCGSDGFSSDRRVDFSTIESTNSCMTPTDVFVADVGNDFFSIGWQENGETAWQVEYGPSGFSLGTGTIIETSQSTITISDLPSQTTYEVYVRANCGSQGFSDYADAIVVTTN
jgi:hypothetical protein